jgi:hypothetical protein
VTGVEDSERLWVVRGEQLVVAELCAHAHGSRETGGL